MGSYFSLRAEAIAQPELAAALAIQDDDLAIKHGVAAHQVAMQAVTQAGKALKRVPIARDQPHAIFVGIQQCAESIVLDFENPITMEKRPRRSAERHWLELRKHCSYFIGAVRLT